MRCPVGHLPKDLAASQTNKILELYNSKPKQKIKQTIYREVLSGGQK
jgi:hypothetical protein